MKESLYEKTSLALYEAGIQIDIGKSNRAQVVLKAYEALKELCNLPTVEATPID